ncbi:MAG: hypothetical protein ACRDWD_13245 [Acidimicrobiia bacterium]
MGWVLDKLDAWGSGALVFLSFTLLGIAVIVVIDVALHALVRDEVRTRASYTAAWALSVLATIYAVLAAFVIVDEYGQLQNTQQAVSDKAAALSAVSENSRALPEGDGQPVRNAALEYATTVVDVGFPSLADRGQFTSRTDRSLEHLFTEVQDVEPTSRSDTAFYDQIVVNLDRVVQTRTTLSTAARQTVPSALVAVLIVNGLTILVIASLLDTKHRRSHLFILGALALTISLSLALVVSLDQPFDGVIRVNDDPMQDFITYRSER